MTWLLIAVQAFGLLASTASLVLSIQTRRITKRANEINSRL